MPALAEAGAAPGRPAPPPSRATGYAMFSHPRLASRWPARGPRRRARCRRPPGRRAGQPLRDRRRVARPRRRSRCRSLRGLSDEFARPQGLQHAQRLLHCQGTGGRARPPLRRRRGGRGRATGGADQAPGRRAQRGLRGSGLVRADGQRAALGRSGARAAGRAVARRPPRHRVGVGGEPGGGPGRGRRPRHRHRPLQRVQPPPRGQPPLGGPGRAAALLVRHRRPVRRRRLPAGSTPVRLRPSRAGLSNWRHGRLFARRRAVGDSMYTVRTRHPDRSRPAR